MAGWGARAGLGLGALGWGLLVASLPHGEWGVGAGGGLTPVSAMTVTRGLWSECSVDAAGLSACVPLLSLLSLPGYVQGGRALGVGAAALGGAGLLLGGGAGARKRLRALGGALVLLAGLGALAAAAWFGAGVSREFWDPQHPGVRLEPGPGLLLAAGGGALAGLGGGALLGSALSRPPSSPRPPGGDKYGRSQYV